MRGHAFIGEDDDYEACLICGGTWYTTDVEAGRYSYCSGITTSVHAGSHCDACTTDEGCQHSALDCDCIQCEVTVYADPPR